MRWNHEIDFISASMGVFTAFTREYLFILPMGGNTGGLVCTDCGNQSMIKTPGLAFDFDKKRSGTWAV